jgi:hypothetical protein
VFASGDGFVRSDDAGSTWREIELRGREWLHGLAVDAVGGIVAVGERGTVLRVPRP